MNGVSLLKCICDETRFEILELLQKNNYLVLFRRLKIINFRYKA